MVKNWTPLRWTLVIGVTLLGGGLLISGLATHFESFVSDAPDTVPVLVVGQYVPPYAAVSARQLTIKNYPPELVPPGAFHGLKEILREDGKPLFLSAVALPVGQPLSRTLVTEVDKSHGMASMLSIGKEAVSFSVDKVRAVGGWIKPGDTISIFSTSIEVASDHHPIQTTRLLFPAAEVIAVNKGRLGEESHGVSGMLKDIESDDTSEEDCVLTVRMNPVEAAALVQARESGHLSVTLRALGDDLSSDETQSISVAAHG